MRRLVIILLPVMLTLSCKTNEEVIKDYYKGLPPIICANSGIYHMAACRTADEKFYICDYNGHCMPVTEPEKLFEVVRRDQ